MKWDGDPMNYQLRVNLLAIGLAAVLLLLIVIRCEAYP